MYKVLFSIFLVLCILCSCGVLKYQSDLFAMTEDVFGWAQGVTDFYFSVYDLLGIEGRQKYVVFQLGSIYYYLSYETMSSDTNTFIITSSDLPNALKFSVNQGFSTINVYLSDGSTIHRYCSIYKQPFTSDEGSVKAMVDDLNGKHGGGGTDF